MVVVGLCGVVIDLQVKVEGYDLLILGWNTSQNLSVCDNFPWWPQGQGHVQEQGYVWLHILHKYRPNEVGLGSNLLHVLTGYLG